MGVFWLQDIFKTMAAKTEGLRVNKRGKGCGADSNSQPRILRLYPVFRQIMSDRWIL